MAYRLDVIARLPKKRSITKFVNERLSQLQNCRVLVNKLSFSYNLSIRSQSLSCLDMFLTILEFLSEVFYLYTHRLPCTPAKLICTVTQA